jgi:signal transduction histidine kinase
MFMKTKSLRARIVLAFSVFGISISLLFGLSTLYIRTTVENALVTEQLQRDVDELVGQVREDPTKRPGTSILQAWTYSPRTIYRAPLGWQSVGTGVHDMQETSFDGLQVHYKLAVRTAEDITGFVRYNVARDELTTRQLKVAVAITIAVFSLLSFIIGYWSSNRVIRPVRDLARRVRKLRGVAKRQHLAPFFAQDEVGELAIALDDYADQLTDLINRDRYFNADVSHELRTPLAVVASTAELMAASPEQSPKQSERLARIRRATAQCSNLIETLLLLSRSERAPPSDGEYTDVGGVVEEVVDSCQVLLAKKTVTLQIVEDAKKVAVVAPPAVLTVALNNLVGNACKYTLEGRIDVRITPDSVIIEDTGPGLSQSPELLFERGARGDDAGGKGAGLGLAIVKRICELYGWEVSLQSSVSGGARAELAFHKG